MIDNSKLEQIADNIIDTVLDYVRKRHGQEAYEIVASWREKDWLKKNIIDNLSYTTRYDDEVSEAMAPFYPAFDNADLLVRYVDGVDFQTDDKVFMKEAVAKILLKSVWRAKKDDCKLLYEDFSVQVPMIYVKDNDSDCIHLVGSNPHDKLYLDRNNQIAYENMQNGCCSIRYNEEKATYEFIAEEQEAGYGCVEYVIKMVPWKEAAEIYRKMDAERTENNKLLKKMVKHILKERG